MARLDGLGRQQLAQPSLRGAAGAAVALLLDRLGGAAGDALEQRALAGLELPLGDDPEVAQQPPGAAQRHAPARAQAERPVARHPQRPGRIADAGRMQALHDLRAGAAGEDAVDPHGVGPVVVVGAVGQRPQPGVVDQDRLAQALAEPVDDVLERRHRA
jgi:hypothetical protein